MKCLYCKKEIIVTDKFHPNKKYCSLGCSRKYRYYNNDYEKKQEYRENNREKHNEYMKEYRKKNREKMCGYLKTYRKENREECKIRDNNYYKKNKIKFKEYKQQKKIEDPEKYKRQKHESYMRCREKHIESCRLYANKRRQEDEGYKLRHYLSTRMWYALSSKCVKKSRSFEKYIGCSIEELKEYLSKQFIEDMTWDNYGEWHVDHIIPCCIFDLTIEDEQMKCFNYTNLQPLWGPDNLSKGGRINANVHI